MDTFVSDDGLNIAYTVDDFTDPWTTPETIILLHAAMGSSKRWFRWVPRLVRDYRVVRMDLRGHGQSQQPAPDQDFSLSLLVGDVLKLMEHLGIDKAHVAGNSAGGYVAQQLAIHHGERVRTLALIAATPGLKNSHAPTWIPKIRERGMRAFLLDTIKERFDDTADPDLVSWFVEEASARDPEFMARFVLHMSTHDFMEDLPGITAPTLMIAPGGEQIGHAETYREMQRRITGSRLVYIDTRGHNIGDGYPDRCADELLAFLRTVR